MPLINLIQEQRIAARRQSAQARAGLFGFVAASVAAAGACGFLMYLQDRVSSDLARLKAETQRLAPLAREIEVAEKDIAQLNPRIETLETAHETSARWSRLLEHLAVNTPRDTWLTGVRGVQNEPGKPIGVQINGLGKAQQPISEFIMRTQNAPDLQNVSLRFTQERQEGERRSIEFEVFGELKGTGEDKPKDKEKKA